MYTEYESQNDIYRRLPTTAYRTNAQQHEAACLHNIRLKIYKGNLNITGLHCWWLHCNKRDLILTQIIQKYKIQ